MVWRVCDVGPQSRCLLGSVQKPPPSTKLPSRASLVHSARGSTAVSGSVGPWQLPLMSTALFAVCCTHAAGRRRCRRPGTCAVRGNLRC